MAGINKTVSAENDATTLDGTELTRIVQGGASVKTTLQNIANLAPPAPLTTKGDLLGYGTGLTRIPVGPNGDYALTADSSQTLGVKWGGPYTRNVDLADTTDGTKGAGRVGFLSSLTYTAGTVGGFLTSLLNSANGSGADLIGGVGRVVNSIAAIRLLSKAGVGKAFALGYYASGDKGGGAYYYDSSDTTSLDNGGTILVASDGGRWKLAHNGVVTTSQFGCKGDGVTDDTTALSAAMSAAANGAYKLLLVGVLLCGAITNSVNDLVIQGTEGSKFLQKVGTYSAGSFHIVFSGARVSLTDVEFDGQQFSLTSSGQGSNGLALANTAISPTFLRVTAHRYNGVGFTLYSANNTLVGSVTTSYREGTFTDCHFDDNAGLGMNTIAASYHDFIGCTWDRNGYGYQKTRSNYADTSHGFAAFGASIRLRSHHITVNGGSARDNGKDGFNINQGSYAIKVSQFLVHGNDDGGITFATDNTGSGLPGEGEACYDCEIIDAETYNNFTSGICGYGVCNNITVRGGRNYNNNRVAGYLAAQSSYPCGVFFAGGSTGIVVDTKCYDDRQSRTITAVSGSGTTRTLTATGWVAGTMYYYPNVAIYSGVDGSFQGYGRITAESSGSVTIQASSNNAVTLASIAVGMIVSQAVQHIGIFVDNGSEARIEADGFGHRPGPLAYTPGRLMGAGYFANGQNVTLPKQRLSPIELLANPSFDAGITNWAFSNPTGGSATAYTGATRRSAGALQLIGGTSANNFADATLVPSALQHCLGEFVEFGGWCYATVAGDAVIMLYTGSATYNASVTHPGGGWRYLRVGLQVSPSDSGVQCRIWAITGKTTIWDECSFRAVDSATDNRDYSPVSRYLPL